MSNGVSVSTSDIVSIEVDWTNRIIGEVYGDTL